MGRRIRKNNRKPLTDINGNQVTLQAHASKKRNNSKNVSQKPQISRSPTANSQTKSDQSPINSSSRKPNNSSTNGKKMSKNQRKKKRAFIEANKKTGTEMVVYDEIFAQKQKKLHLDLCCVCGTVQYSMKCCRRCNTLKYCSHECLIAHCTDKVQKEACDRYVAFINGRQRISQDIINKLYASGITEISPYLYSVPRREVYEMQNGPINAILLQILQLNFDEPNHLNVVVQDLTGQMTILRIQSFRGFSKMGNVDVYIDRYQQSLKDGEFLLLINGHWNNHRDRDSAAIDIVNLLQIMPLPDKTKLKQGRRLTNIIKTLQAIIYQ